MPIDLSFGAIDIALDEATGAFLALSHRRLGVDLIRERRLARNFRVLLPLGDWRGHYIEGHEQTLREVRRREAGADLVYGPLRSERGEFDVRLVLSIDVHGDDVNFSYVIDNATSLTIEEVIWPALGGLVDDDSEGDWTFHANDLVGKGTEWPFYRDFPGTYLGPARPIWIRAYPHDTALPWVDLYHRKRRVGVSLACHNVHAEWSTPFLQLHPGTVYGKNGQKWPRRAALAPEELLGATLGWASFPFAAAGRTEGPQTVLYFHAGDWHAAADHYRAWFQTHWPVTPKTSWLGREDAWQSNIISYPEDTIEHRFEDIPKLAAEAARRGIHVLQIDGWDIGGIDRGYPDYTPDPRLGTAEELAAAIRACRELGVGVMLFSNLTVANIETDWFKRELHEYAAKDPRGFARNTMGWEYHTLMGLAKQAESRMVFMNPSHRGWSDIMQKQLLGLLDLGAPGTQIDKVHGMAQVDFSPGLDDHPGRSFPTGVLKALQAFRGAAVSRDAGFGIASETHWDRAIPYVDAAYSRFFGHDHLPTIGYSFPEFRQSCAIPGPHDIPLVNNSIRFGHIINIEPNYLHGSLADSQRMGAYVQEALRLRRSLRHVLWDSRIDEGLDVALQRDGAVLSTRHRSLAGPSSALVLTHFEDAAQSVEVSIEGATSAMLHVPFEEAREVALPARVKLPVDGLAVLVPNT